MYSLQAARLIRTHWRDPWMLAKELYAMFQENVPLEHSGPVTLNNPGNGVPYITLRDYTDGDRIFNLTRQGEDVGSFTFEDGQPAFIPAGSTTPTSSATSGASSQTSSFAGKIISGSGATYQVAVYEGGLSAAPTTRTVTQLQIDGAATIPVDTWAMVFRQRDGQYIMQVPVWL